MSSQYKLYYFGGIRARGEPIRMILKYANQQFEDVHLGPEEFQKLKPSLPNGQIPVLYIDDHCISQSSTILRFLANRFNLSGKDEFERARADEILCVYYDRFQEQLPYMLHKLGNPKFTNGDQLYSEEFLPSAKKTLAYYDSLLSKGHPFLLKSGVSVADFVVAEHLETINNWYPESIKDFPKLVDYKKKVYSLPNLTDYIKGRKQTEC